MPNLLVIGVGRCGTTSLHHYLGGHPEIAMSAIKELNFFSGDIEPAAEPKLHDPADAALIDDRHETWSKSLDWYRSHFDPSSAVRGESSPTYSSPWRGGACAERIARLVPDVRLIYCVRDPVDCAISHYRMSRSSGRERRSIDDALRPDGYYAQASRMALRLEPYLVHFDLERIHIVDNEDLQLRRRDTLRGVFGFLGVDDEYWSVDFQRRWNPAGAGSLGRVLRRVGRRVADTRLPVLRRATPSWWLYRLTRSRSAGRGPELSSAARERLASALAPDAERLRRLTGRSFAGWSI